jgi:hypothetical protein
MWKQAVLESNDEYERELETFGGVGRHQSYRRVSLVLIGVRHQCRVIDKLA